MEKTLRNETIEKVKDLGTNFPKLNTRITEHVKNKTKNSFFLLDYSIHPLKVH